MPDSKEAHSFGPTCAYYMIPDDEPKDDCSPPAVNAQFFYVSALPIDDPLSPVPQTSSGTNLNHAPQAFSAKDNAALEEAWQGFLHAPPLSRDESSKPARSSWRHNIDILAAGAESNEHRVPSSKGKPDTRHLPTVASEEEVLLAQTHGVDTTTLTVGELQSQDRDRNIPQQPQQRHRSPFRRLSRSYYGPKDADKQTRGSKDSAGKESQSEVVRVKETSKKADLYHRPSVNLTSRLSGVWRSKSPSKSESSTTAASTTKSDGGSAAVSAINHKNCVRGRNDSTEREVSESHVEGSKKATTHPAVVTSASTPSEHVESTDGAQSDFASQPEAEAVQQNFTQLATSPAQPPTLGNLSTAVSGRPFARVPSRREVTLFSASAEEQAILQDTSESRDPRSPERPEKSKKVFVPVGVSRLHLVEFPDLVMKPIYWNPINDTSTVIRATWYYQDTMTPLPTEVANRLEIGYEDIKPYSSSYQSELDACVENGAAAETKIVYKLWPEDSRPTTSTGGTPQNNDSAKSVSSVVPQTQTNAAADPRNNTKSPLYKTSSVIYADHKHAQILKPSLLPSETRARAPLRAVRKGRQIGIAVVRGFDRKSWQKLHPDPKLDEQTANARVGAYMSQSGDATTRGRRMSCGPCDRASTIPKVFDLVLVVHGIGQKLSERVDSYHFTHATNTLRREFNVQLSSEAVRGSLNSQSGIMVLPVNWRLTMSFDNDTAPAKSTLENKYTLEDVTPDTLHSVRSLVSDVMLDIPYYMSHHKEKMIAAVIKEANRVYRLWCRNNPGFESYGRVHLIAHSLGSAMAIDILSRQPTRVPRALDLYHGKPSDSMLEFDTINLFCCGSPAGFFLLLHNANLVPRRGRRKPGMGAEDEVQDVALDGPGQYGCLAVNNLYNVINRNDPISYEMNACVDSTLAASLQQALIPSATTGILARISSTMRWTSTSASNAYTSTAPLMRPQLESMPSTVEMETHNFSREEIAEKRMLLLNENGQIDYYLSAGGGALELQYLNMLSAHSSYWLSQDFVRFLVVEIGRKPGKDHTLPVLRAAKQREMKKGSMV